MKPSGKLFFILFLGIVLCTAAQGDEKFPSEIHGYISQGFLYSNHNNYLADSQDGTFQFNELGINFSTQVTDKLRLGVQFAALDLGDVGNDKVTIDWAYADYRWKDWLGFRAGKIKIPMGFYNKTRDIDMLRTNILLPQSIYSETFRDTLVAMKGIGAYGEISLGTFGGISYELLGGTMNIDKDSSTTKGVEGQGIFKVDKYNVKNAFCGQIAWETPLKGLRLGVSRINLDLNVDGVLGRDFAIPPFPPYSVIIPKGTPIVNKTPNLVKVIYSLEYTWKDLILAMEFSHQDQVHTTYIPGLEPVKRIQLFQAFYASVSYRFSNWFETGFYYSEFYQNRNDKSGTKTPFNPPFYAFQKDACLTFRFDPNDHWTFKMEGHLMNGTGLCFSQDNLDDKGNREYTRLWHLLAAKMTFSF